jgi:type IV pilus assembly protein PilC
MPQYQYLAKNMEGKTLQEIEEATSEQALVDKLQGQGYFVISLQAMRTEAPKSEARKTRKVKKDMFTHKGISMDDILVVSLVEVGEASGTMPQVLEKLAVFMEQQAAFRSIIISAIIYPCILLIVCLGAIGFFAFFVGPKFEAIYTSMGKELPAFTKLLLAVFKFIKQNIVFLFLACMAAVFAFRQYIKTAVGQMQYEKFIYSLPTFGMITKKIVVERFASQMSILIDSGVPILYALEISEKLVENRTCGLIISDIRDAVREGKMLAEPMELSGFFPPMAVQMIKVGEETGELSKMLKHVSGFFQREVEAFMKRFGTVIEPLMLVVMGGVIGTIVLAMFLPMFSMGS